MRLGTLCMFSFNATYDKLITRKQLRYSCQNILRQSSLAVVVLVIVNQYIQQMSSRPLSNCVMYIPYTNIIITTDCDTWLRLKKNRNLIVSNVQPHGCTFETIKLLLRHKKILYYLHFFAMASDWLCFNVLPEYNVIFSVFTWYSSLGGCWQHLSPFWCLATCYHMRMFLKKRKVHTAMWVDITPRLTNVCAFTVSCHVRIKGWVQDGTTSYIHSYWYLNKRRNSSTLSEGLHFASSQRYYGRHSQRITKQQCTSLECSWVKMLSFCRGLDILGIITWLCGFWREMTSIFPWQRA